MKTQLKDRVLWYDGTNQVKPEEVPSLILAGIPISNIVVEELNDDLELFNSLEDEQFPSSKSENSPLLKNWNIPQNYLTIDLKEYSFNLLKQKIDPESDKYIAYHNRLIIELQHIEKNKLENLFRTLIYVVDTLNKNNQVYGVGRGSSCASLFLYLIDLHKVDPIKYNIPISEFFHD